MKQLFLTLTVCSVFAFTLFGFVGYYQKWNLTGTPQQVFSGNANLNKISVINTNTNTVYVKFYDFAPYYSGTVHVTAPSYTVTPKYVLQCYPNSQIFTDVINSPSQKTVWTFTAGVSVKAVEGFAPTNTVSPSDSVYIDIEY